MTTVRKAIEDTRADRLLGLADRQIRAAASKGKTQLSIKDYFIAGETVYDEVVFTLKTLGFTTSSPRPDLLVIYWRGSYVNRENI